MPLDPSEGRDIAWSPAETHQRKAPPGRPRIGISNAGDAEVYCNSDAGHDAMPRPYEGSGDISGGLWVDNSV